MLPTGLRRNGLAPSSAQLDQVTRTSALQLSFLVTLALPPSPQPPQLCVLVLQRCAQYLDHRISDEFLFDPPGFFILPTYFVDRLSCFPRRFSHLALWLSPPGSMLPFCRHYVQRSWLQKAANFLHHNYVMRDCNFFA